MKKVNAGQKGLIKDNKIRIRAGFLLAAGAAATAVFAQILIYDHGKHPAAGYLLFVPAVIMLYMAGKIFQDKEIEAGIPVRAEAIIVSLITVFGIILRSYRLSGIPPGFYYDEATIAETAVKIMKGMEIDHVKNPVFVQWTIQYPAFMIYITAFIFKAFGAGIAQARSVPVIMGALSIPAFYFLARRFFSIPAAVAGAVLIATMRWHINFSRVGFYAAFGILLVILALYFLWRAYTSKKWSDFVLMGLSAGLVTYGYTPGRMFFAGGIIFSVYILFRDFGFYRENYRKILLSAAVFLAVFTPLSTYFLSHPGVFTARTKEVSLLSAPLVERWFHGRLTVKQAVADSAKKTLLMFSSAGDMNARHNNPGYPVIGFFTGALAMLGLGMAIMNIYRAKYFYFISMFAVFLVPGMITIEAPQAHRTVFTLIFVIMFFLVAFENILKAGYSAGKISKRAVMIAAGLLLAVISADNINTYFNRHMKNPETYAQFMWDIREIAEYLSENNGKIHAFVYASYLNVPFNFIFSGREKNYEEFSMGGTVPIKTTKNTDYVYILPWELEELVPLFQQLYPGGRYKPVYAPYSGEKRLLYYYYEVPFSSAAAVNIKEDNNGLSARYYSGAHWNGDVKIERTDPMILFHWQKPPVAGVFSAEWRGKIRADTTGIYFFMTNSDDLSEVYINGQLAYSEKSRGRLHAVRMGRGKNDILVKYSHSNTSVPKLLLRWKIPGQRGFDTVPFNVLFTQ